MYTKDKILWKQNLEIKKTILTSSDLLKECLPGYIKIKKLQILKNSSHCEKITKIFQQ